MRWAAACGATHVGSFAGFTPLSRWNDRSGGSDRGALLNDATASPARSASSSRSRARAITKFADGALAHKPTVTTDRGPSPGCSAIPGDRHNYEPGNVKAPIPMTSGSTGRRPPA